MEVADAQQFHPGHRGGHWDGYNRVDVFLSCREMEFDGDRGDDFGDGERTSPLVVQLLHGAVGGIVLEIQPGLVSDLVLWCCLMVPVIIPLHVICCPFKGSLSSWAWSSHLVKVSTASTVNVFVGSTPRHGCCLASSSNGV